MRLDDFLARLRNVKASGQNHWQADCPCPSHKSPQKHLSVSVSDAKILVKCFGNDTAEDIVQALGLEMTDLFLDDQKLPPTGVKAETRKIVAEYSYQDESGHELFQVVRYEPKSFSQRHKNGQGNWVYDITGIRRVLYHLPALAMAETVYLVEGEKDADRLWEYGQVGTTSPGGAGNWKLEYAEMLSGKQVVIIPDNDTAGMNYARDAARSLQGKAQTVRCVILPGAKDFSEWIVENDIAILPGLEQDIAVLFEPVKPDYKRDNEVISWEQGGFLFRAENIRQERTGIHARISVLQNYQTLGWSTFNIERSEDRIKLANQIKKNDTDIRQWLDLFCAGLWAFEVSAFKPEIMEGVERTTPPSFLLDRFILENGGSILFSPPGRGKSYSALTWAVSIDSGVSLLWQVQQRNTLYINLERSGLQYRLACVNKVLGLPANRPLLTFNARGHSLTNLVPAIRSAIHQHNIRFIVLDSISRAGLGDVNESGTANSLIDTLNKLCPTWLALGHTPRASDEHLIGSVMADAGADIVIQLRSQSQSGKLGVGYEIVKANEGTTGFQSIYAYEFQDWQLTGIRKAKPFEFPDIEAKAKIDMLQSIMDFILNQDSGDATATQLEKELGFNRVNISRLLNHSNQFVKTRQVKHSQFFGVKSLLSDEDESSGK